LIANRCVSIENGFGIISLFWRYQRIGFLLQVDGVIPGERSVVNVKKETAFLHKFIEGISLAIFGYVPFCPNLLKTNCIGGGIVDLKKC
jgi:hypothetical protein